MSKAKEAVRRKHKADVAITNVLKCVQQRQVDGVRVLFDAVRMFLHTNDERQIQVRRQHSWGRLLRSFTPQSTSHTSSLIGLDVDPFDVLLQCAINIPQNADISTTCAALHTAVTLTYLMTVVKAVGHICFAPGIGNSTAQHSTA